MDWRRGIFAVVAVAVAGCDQVMTAPAAPAPVVVQPTTTPVADLGDFAGRSFAEFVAAHQERFAPAAMGLSSADGARLERATATSSGTRLEGGGSEGLVFHGCAVNGCAEGLAVVAVDAATGEAFVGVRDGGGTDVLIPNDRLEALLRLNSPTRDWIDAVPAQTAQVTQP